MKKLLLIFAFLIPFLGISQNPNKWVIDKVFENIIPYKNHFIADDGVMISDRLTKAYYEMSIENEMEESIQFGWMGGAASSKRSDGIYDFYEKIYDLGASFNNGEQTTEGSQTYVHGNIAPSQNEAMLNPSGDSRYMTHPEISFGATDEWSVTTCLNWNGSSATHDAIWGKSGTGGLRIRINTLNKFFFISESNTQTALEIDNSFIIGKNTILTFVAEGDNTLGVYTNGVYFGTINSVTDIIFQRIGFGRFDYSYSSINAHIIRNIALDSTQASNEAIFLQSVYPEIPSVTIGEQTWATDNYRAVATPEGTVIAEVTEAANVEQLPSWDFTTWVTAGNGSIIDNNSFSSTAIGGIVKNTIFTTGKYYKLVISGSTTATEIECRQSDFGGANHIAGSIGVGFGTFYFKAVKSSMYIRQPDAGTTDVTTLSIEEVGWSGSQDLKTGLVSQGESEADANEAAAFWVYHENDSEIGSVYGKEYNGAARDVIVADIVTQGDWGYHIATEAEWTALLTNEEVTLKKGGTDYWNTTGGTNSTGFTAIGGASRLANGTFGTIKNYIAFWCGDSDKVCKIYHDGTAAEIVVADLDEGAYVRFVKD